MLTFIGAPHENQPRTGTAKTLEQAQEKAQTSLAKDHEFFTRYQERMERNLAQTLSSLDDDWGLTAKKAEAPTVSGLCLKAADTGRVLMLQRCLDSGEKDEAAGKWEWPGGHHEEDDATSLHAAIREWTEEVGQPFPTGGYVAHTWLSPDGVYAGHVVVIPEEKSVVLHEGRVEENPDDPDSEYCEQVAWWDPDDAKDNPALRRECRDNPWDEIKKASAS